MTVAALINRPCTIIRRSTSTTDEYGDPILDDTSEDTVCEFQQALSGEEDLEQAETREYRVWFHDSVTPPTGGDALLVDGDLYEFTGPANLLRNPRTGANSHIQARVRRVS